MADSPYELIGAQGDSGQRDIRNPLMIVYKSDIERLRNLGYGADITTCLHQALNRLEELDDQAS